jgi:hypothetical protein
MGAWIAEWLMSVHYTENVCTDTNHSGIQAPDYTENVCTDTNLHRKCLYRYQPLSHPGPTLHRAEWLVSVQTFSMQVGVCTNIFWVIWGLDAWVVGVCTNIFCVMWGLAARPQITQKMFVQTPTYTENVCTDTNHSATQAPHYTENVCTDTNHSATQAPHYISEQTFSV